MGTPEFAVIILQALIREPEFEIAAVYTRPPKRSGRGMRTGESPVEKAASVAGIPCFQPSSLRDAMIVEEIAALEPDFIVVAAYGLILPQTILDVPRFGCLNVHGSILPEYRGAAPIQRAILEKWGEGAQTGVSIMEVIDKLDAGGVYAVWQTPIGHKSQEELARELAINGAVLLVDVMKRIIAESLKPVPQDEASATYAEKLTKDEGRIDWSEAAEKIDAQIRAFTPWPGTRTAFVFGQSAEPLEMAIISARPAKMDFDASVGSIYVDNGRLFIACGKDWLEVEELKPSGRKAVKAKDFVNGQRLAKKGFCGQAGNEDRTPL